VGTTAIDVIAKLQNEDKGIFAFSSPEVKHKLEFGGKAGRKGPNSNAGPPLVRQLTDRLGKFVNRRTSPRPIFGHYWLEVILPHEPIREVLCFEVD
jgi:hypothetical protein